MWRCPWLLICVTVCLLLDYPTYSRQQDGASGTAIYKEDYREYYVILGLQALYMGRAGPARVGKYAGIVLSIIGVCIAIDKGCV